jgi:hypothetical protein
MIFFMVLSLGPSATVADTGGGEAEAAQHPMPRRREAERACADNNRQQNCERDIPFHGRLL